jgi:hypothetical protein
LTSGIHEAIVTHTNRNNEEEREMSKDDDLEAVKKRACELNAKFGNLAPLVVEEIISMAKGGYDYDAQFEIPFYSKVKDFLDTIKSKHLGGPGDWYEKNGFIDGRIRTSD